MTDLKDGIAIVTGAGGGLGRELARALIAKGVHVAGFGRNHAALEETSTDALFTPVLVDLSRPEDIARGFADVAALPRPLTILINNAGVYPRADFLEASPKDFMAAVDVNLGAVVHCCHAALQAMVETGFGRIVNVTTFADLAPIPRSAAYSVSKGAARIFTRALLQDVGDRFPDIVINDWIPGALATRMGLPDGIAPQKAAAWGAELALWHDRSLTGTLFDRNSEFIPPRSLKGRIKDTVLMQKTPKARHLGAG